MKRTGILASALLLLMSLSLVLLAPHDAGATIVVTGSLEFPGTLCSPPCGIISLTSDERGFALLGGGDIFGGIFAPRSNFQPGDTISLRATWSGGDFGGWFTIDGATYSMGSSFFPMICPPMCGDGRVEFSGGAVAPPFDGLTSAAVTAPFTFSGRIEYVTIPPPFFQTSSETLTGFGTAEIQLARIPVSPEHSTWEFRSASYDFQTPEPNTVLLLGSGFAVLGGMAWRGRHSH